SGREALLRGDEDRRQILFQLDQKMRPVGNGPPLPKPQELLKVEVEMPPGDPIEHFLRRSIELQEREGEGEVRRNRAVALAEARLDFGFVGEKRAPISGGGGGGVPVKSN